MRILEWAYKHPVLTNLFFGGLLTAFLKQLGLDFVFGNINDWLEEKWTEAFGPPGPLLLEVASYIWPAIGAFVVIVLVYLVAGYKFKSASPDAKDLQLSSAVSKRHYSSHDKDQLATAISILHAVVDKDTLALIKYGNSVLLEWKQKRSPKLTRGALDKYRATSQGLARQIDDMLHKQYSNYSDLLAIIVDFDAESNTTAIDGAYVAAGDFQNQLGLLLAEGSEYLKGNFVSLMQPHCDRFSQANQNLVAWMDATQERLKKAKSKFLSH